MRIIVTLTNKSTCLNSNHTCSTCSFSYSSVAPLKLFILTPKFLYHPQNWPKYDPKTPNLVVFFLLKLVKAQDLQESVVVTPKIIIYNTFVIRPKKRSWHKPQICYNARKASKFGVASQKCVTVSESNEPFGVATPRIC